MSEILDVRREAARLVRDWADRRRIAWRSAGGLPPQSGPLTRDLLSDEQVELLRRCADDVERGMP